ncbi:hypothetical protein A2526_05870 [candidate division WOR-1 bacterium RIFOXYD2_FULL_36_8]|uniref:Uncharacterized protein n=1 Tax=candidate division WOR-1 bacterium RIFOXYB2_FULL_36_35 TaxID=1802578 RepID=A0A1F4RYP1_UNCSA|nr:MAG: hypothetical protein A2230_08790 [candidate division WOR-1 bacterium RIFOXYA2_FULL_36_21]OGC13306.1 MAG: hypothetical protein A2290_08235 [candidate division WOR-1 bacterium RIFOXYB2_FULL_36_35]OGC16785.1 MAG: hypothetical protein A2282_04815 [candidate division WOR-1 bacterium RIFOXYA12_FULL_36_13]OGC37460.1 MAG: hypothetical protein A2526_05870 [candidate division WOR-1 bacterium RIFOXYD2_FULL_36_8]
MLYIKTSYTYNYSKTPQRLLIVSSKVDEESSVSSNGAEKNGEDEIGRLFASIISGDLAAVYVYKNNLSPFTKITGSPELKIKAALILFFIYSYKMGLAGNEPREQKALLKNLKKDLDKIFPGNGKAFYSGLDKLSGDILTLLNREKTLLDRQNLPNPNFATRYEIEGLKTDKLALLKDIAKQLEEISKIASGKKGNPKVKEIALKAIALRQAQQKHMRLNFEELNALVSNINPRTTDRDIHHMLSQTSILKAL